MESLKYSSPIKNITKHEFSDEIASPNQTTPVRQNERKNIHTTFRSSISSFTVLPTHKTPPSGLTKFIARNPFDADLTSRLHLSVISPTVFSKVSSSRLQDSPGFSWSVDELALIKPAKIEEFPTQVHCTDPHLEFVAQAAIDRFFQENQIIPSPWNIKNKESEVINEKCEMRTPSRPLEDLNLTRENKSKKDCWTQTVLTLPPQLPKEVEEALKPFFTFNQDQNVDTDDANSSNNSLRRKLFFNHDDCTEDDEETSLSMSPMARDGSVICSASPPQSGMLVHGTPLQRGSFDMQRTHGTPGIGNISPPDMSPIGNNDDMSFQGTRSRLQFSGRLDFTTDMSIDVSIRDNKELRPLEEAELEINGSLLRSNLISGQVISNECNKTQHIHDADPRQNETTEMLSQDNTPLKLNENQDCNISTSKSNEILHRLKLSADWCKNHPNESNLLQNNTLLGNSNSGQQSTLYSAQDTGYQTNSMSNITGITDNCSITPVKQGFHWNDKVISTGDEIQLSEWQDNMKNMFSSTPSKYTRRRDIS